MQQAATISLRGKAAIAGVTLGLAWEIFYWSVRLPGAPWLVGRVIGSEPWRWLHGLVASVRSSLGAYGPEEDGLLLLQCQAVGSVALSVVAVWFVNRLLWRFVTSRARLNASRRHDGLTRPPA